MIGGEKKTTPPDIPTLGDVRGKIVILQHDFGKPERWNNQCYGLNYDGSFFPNKQDYWGWHYSSDAHQDWVDKGKDLWPPGWSDPRPSCSVYLRASHLYHHWGWVKHFLHNAITWAEDGFVVNSLNGASEELMQWPYFVASGHKFPPLREPKTEDERMDGLWLLGGQYPDFPMVGGRYRFEGTNDMTLNELGKGITFTDIVMIDFPGGVRYSIKSSLSTIKPPSLLQVDRMFVMKGQKYSLMPAVRVMKMAIYLNISGTLEMALRLQEHAYGMRMVIMAFTPLLSRLQTMMEAKEQTSSPSP